MSMFNGMQATRTVRTACVAGLSMIGMLPNASDAFADQPTALREFASAETLIKQADVPTMHVVLRPSLMHNRAGDAPRFGNRGPGCPQNVASYVDAALFNGGTFIIEQGFGQGEIAAVSYPIAASAFPIKIDLMEAIFATANATVQTVTHWSILVWDGDPSTGTLVAEYSSDDVILPHARIGPGTAGVNIQVSVDPQDPDQIFVNDQNGSHKFSIGYRIDHHNNQTQDPCQVAPPISTNAFPTVDSNGRAQPSNNWLFGLNCGPIGCPNNGGWATFASLLSFCRPSGDWVMRATWESVNCAPATGACCNTGACSVSLQSICSSGGGTYQGDNSVCSPNPCPAPTGACCFTGGSCQVRTQASCSGFGGTYGGNNVACTAGGTCPTGACCLTSGTCVAAQLATQCAAQGGTLQAIGSTCSPNPCPQPTGACCLTASGFCNVETQPNCNIPGTVWRGAGTVCSVATCPSNGACCASNGFCSDETQANCAGVPGATFQGIGSSCTPNPCNASGACCCGSTCSVTAPAACNGAGRVYVGNNTTCNAASNNTTPCCRADYNHTNGISVQDIFDFLSGYFSTDACANINGTGGISVQDIFDFLTAYFGGGC